MSRGSAITGLLNTVGDVVALTLDANTIDVSYVLFGTWQAVAVFEATQDGAQWFGISATPQSQPPSGQATQNDQYTVAVRQAWQATRIRLVSVVQGPVNVSIQNSVAPPNL